LASRPASGPTARKWYDPTGWPEPVRWVALVPLPVGAAIVAFVIYSVVNGIFPDMPSALTGLLAVVVAASAYVGLSRLLAPSFDRLIGVVQVGAVCLFAAYMVAKAVLEPARNGSPTWYTILFGVAAIGGAVYGSSVALEGSAAAVRREVYAWMPAPLRWVLFIPIALLLAVLSAAAFGLLLYALHVSADAAKLVNTILMSAIFIGVASAVAPCGKNVVGIVFALIFGFFAVFQILAGAFRPVAAQMIAGYFHKDLADVAFDSPVWYQLLTGFGLLAGAVVGALGAVRAERDRRAASRNV
jgi:hypothetical protein